MCELQGWTAFSRWAPDILSCPARVSFQNGFQLDCARGAGQVIIMIIEIICNHHFLEWIELRNDMTINVRLDYVF